MSGKNDQDGFMEEWNAMQARFVHGERLVQIQKQEKDFSVRMGCCLQSVKVVKSKEM